MARTCILRAFGLQIPLRLSLVVRLFCFALLCSVFRLYVFFVEATALRSIVLRYAGAPNSHTCFFPFVYLEMSLFPSFFGAISAFSLYGEYVVHVLSFRTMFFYLVTTDWIFDITLCENSIKFNSKLKIQILSLVKKTLCMYGHTYSKSMDQPDKVASPARGQLNRENEYFPVRVRA